MSPTEQRTTVVIVNYRTAEMCIDAVRSLASEGVEEGRLDVVVVDNSSGDGSAERIAEAVRREGWEGWVSLIPLADNRGFAAGNNAGIALALAREPKPAAILLLNPDTLVRPGAVRALVELMESRPDVGIAGCRLEYADGATQSRAFRFPTLMSEVEASLKIGAVTRLLGRWVVAPPPPDVLTDSDWVSGACMLVRREVFEDVGLMDDGYFLYFEEVDLCLAASRRGWRCAYLPDVTVVHFHGASTGNKLFEEPKRIPKHWLDSRRRYFVKNHGLPYAACADLLHVAGLAVSHALRRALGREIPDPPHALWDLARSGVQLHLSATKGR